MKYRVSGRGQVPAGHWSTTIASPILLNQLSLFVQAPSNPKCIILLASSHFMAIRPRSPIIAEEGPQSGIGSQPPENRPKFLQSWQIILSTDHQTSTPGQSTLSFLINYLMCQALSLQGIALNYCTDWFAVTFSAAYYMAVNVIKWLSMHCKGE